MAGKSRAHRFAACALLAALPLWAPAASAEDLEIAKRRAVQRTSFTDAEIVDGFIKVAFGAEFDIEKRTDRIRKFTGPVRVYIDDRAKPNRRRQLERVVADIGAHVANLDIATTRNRSDANVVVRLIRNRDMRRTVRAIFGRTQARRIERSLNPQCLSGFSKDENYRIRQSDVILVVDAGDFIFYDCAYEEMLQALGPINDDASVPWTMFNDNVLMGFFGIYDQYLLNILYHPQIRVGMTVAQAKVVLPKILPEVRAWVAQRNGLARGR